MKHTFVGIKDNNAYVEWCDTHPTGYVYNKRGKGVLHLATCSAITRHGSIENETEDRPKRKVATSTDAKVCYDTKEEMLADLGGEGINRCGMCNP